MVTPRDPLDVRPGRGPLGTPARPDPRPSSFAGGGPPLCEFRGLPPPTWPAVPTARPRVKHSSDGRPAASAAAPDRRMPVPLRQAAAAPGSGWRPAGQHRSSTPGPANQRNSKLQSGCPIQQALAGARGQHLQQQRTQELLRRNRGRPRLAYIASKRRDNRRSAALVMRRCRPYGCADARCVASRHP